MTRLFAALLIFGLTVFAVIGEPIVRAETAEQERSHLGGVPGIDHVIWIWFENREYSAINATSTPYFASLAATYVNFTGFHGITHPSQPNYLHAFSGSSQGMTTNDYCTFPVGTDSLPQQLAAAGKSWRLYAQNFPGGCSDVTTFTGGIDGPGPAGNYDRKHNPAIAFEGTRLDPAQCANIQPLANFDPMVNFAFVVPNNINSMHDGSRAQGDAFLQAFAPQVFNSPDWEHTLFIISFDEGTTNINGGGQIYTVAAAPWLTHSNPVTFYNHHSALRTIEEIYGLPYLNGAATATTMTEVFPAGPTPTSTATSTPTNTPTPLPAIAGTVTYGNAAVPPKFVSNVTITGSGSPTVMTVTDAPGATAGQYSLTGFGAGSYDVEPSKANTHDTAINSFDAARVAQFVAGLTTFTAAQQIVADVSGNSQVQSFDAALLAGYAVGQASGSAGNWLFTPISRSYPSITTDITDEDYSGLLMGEVSGNWSNTGARPAETDHGTVSSEWAVGDGPLRNVDQKTINITTPHLIAPAGNKVVVPVKIDRVAGKEIISYEFDLRYDAAVIQPTMEAVEVVGTISRGLFAVVNSDEPGLLRVAVYGAMPIEEDGVLLNLSFSAVGNPGSLSPLTWERIVFNEGDPIVSAADGQIEISGRVDSGTD